MASREHDTGGGLEAPTERDDGLVATTRRILDPIITVWMAIVRAFSWAVARVVAVVLFVIGFIPYSIVMRLIRFDPLNRRYDPDAESYWKDAESTNDDIDAFRKQY